MTARSSAPTRAARSPQTSRKKRQTLKMPSVEKTSQGSISKATAKATTKATAEAATKATAEAAAETTTEAAAEAPTRITGISGTIVNSQRCAQLHTPDGEVYGLVSPKVLFRSGTFVEVSGAFARKTACNAERTIVVSELQRTR